MVAVAREALRSALYRGVVRHERIGDPSHRFQYRVVMPLLFLAEIDALCVTQPGWSSKHRAPVEFRRTDFLPQEHTGSGDSLAEAVRRVVVESGRTAPSGPIAILANLRNWGWQFNPITLYYCFDPTGTTVETLVVEVTNTPWKQRHTYVVDSPGEHEFSKELHVSPFMSMDHRYQFRYTEPMQHLRLAMSNIREGKAVFNATLELRRESLDRKHANAYTLSCMAPRVSLAIYAEALRLRAKGVSFVPHPDRRHHQTKERLHESH